MIRRTRLDAAVGNETEIGKLKFFAIFCYSLHNSAAAGQHYILLRIRRQSKRMKNNIRIYTNHGTVYKEIIRDKQRGMSFCSFNCTLQNLLDAAVGPTMVLKKGYTT